MPSDHPHATSHRDGHLIVSRGDPNAVQAMNRQIEKIDRHTGRPNHALPNPEITDMVTVYDLDTQSLHCICIHRLDYRKRMSPAVGNVLTFSDPAYAACRTDKLQLATPTYYRDQDDLKPGIRDRHDGILTKDGSKWASIAMGGGAVSCLLSFVCSDEPWVYCASHYRTNCELVRLRKEFAMADGYSAATRIDRPDDFAAWLGIDFALGFDKTADVTLDPIDEFTYARSSYTTSLWEGARPIDTIVHVYHGPVLYEDVSGRVDTQEQLFDPNAGPRAWFTKKTSFRNQSEYRFAVTTRGTPVQQKHYVAVSQELRALTSAL